MTFLNSEVKGDAIQSAEPLTLSFKQIPSPVDNASSFPTDSLLENELKIHLVTLYGAA